MNCKNIIPYLPACSLTFVYFFWLSGYAGYWYFFCDQYLTTVSIFHILSLFIFIIQRANELSSWLNIGQLANRLSWSVNQRQSIASHLYCIIRILMFILYRIVAPFFLTYQQILLFYPPTLPPLNPCDIPDTDINIFVHQVFPIRDKRTPAVRVTSPPQTPSQISFPQVLKTVSLDAKR